MPGPSNNNTIIIIIIIITTTTTTTTITITTMLYPNLVGFDNMSDSCYLGLATC
jgi:hypothetical protein